MKVFPYEKGVTSKSNDTNRVLENYSFKVTKEIFFVRLVSGRQIYRRLSFP